MGERKKKGLTSKTTESDSSNDFKYPDIQSIYDSQKVDESNVSNHINLPSSDTNVDVTFNYFDSQNGSTNTSNLVDIPIDAPVIENDSINDDSNQIKESIFKDGLSNTLEDIQVIDDNSINENTDDNQIKESIVESDSPKSLENLQLDNNSMNETICDNQIKESIFEVDSPKSLENSPLDNNSMNETIDNSELKESIVESDSSNTIDDSLVNKENSITEIIDDNKNIESSNVLYESKNDNLMVEKSNEKIDNISIDYTPHNSINNKKYISYERRLLRFSVVFILSFAIGVILLYQSLIIKNEEYINYTEKSNLDYRVFLKENDFYEDKFLNKDMLYVASLIDYIDIDYLYNFNISEKVDLDFNYNISAKLSIMDSEGKKIYLTKDYKLSEDKNFSLKGSQDHTIIEHISIDYDEYNKIANSFKSTYGLETTSKLSVYLNIDKKSNDDKIKELSPTNNMLIEIPLSEKSISIQMDYKDINNNSNIIKQKSISISNYILAIVAGILLIISLYAVISLLRLIGLLSPKKSKYDKYISKIMRQYDRLIVNSYTCPNLRNYNVVKIKEFNELLDMRDNLKLPIMYYSIIENQKCYFYIVNNTDLYLFILKAVDFDK